jgi:hypothetical protein
MAKPDKTDDKPPETPKQGTYNPQGTAIPTHDLRVTKHETPHAQILKPLNDNNKQETITIPIEEYKHLRNAENFKILGLQKKSTIPQGEATKLTKMLAADNIQTLANEKADDIRKQAEIQKEIAIKKAIDEEKKKGKKKKKKHTMAFTMGGFIFTLLTILITWNIKPERRIALMDAAATLVTEETNQANALTWVFNNAKTNIFWITSTPDPRITLQIQAVLIRNPTIAVTIIATKDAETDFLPIAQELNVTTFALANSLGPISWVVIDKTMIIDATSKIGLAIIPNPTKGHALIEWADLELAPNTRLLHAANL